MKTVFARKLVSGKVLYTVTLFWKKLYVGNSFWQSACGGNTFLAETWL